ncbi:structure-specific endonuclease subunit SLX1 [Hyalella azteca]|uniref:Structure-specific endonuclease subunit SLX1 homolog n=1 Tax=Hyalella azteca TaxID=294128 RepID=A0A8B7N2E4_HYAAZ|nr:structure-specific endonuclease subunit SLX1 [Hyalella azteca]
MTQSKDGFYGVYLLVSENPRFSGRTYIGFTVDPHRRLRQHNRGSHAGGAWRTSHKGPWSMVLVTHGFPNEVSALRVEWAWQHPEASRRLRGVPRKKASESRLAYSVRLLGCLLQTPPWCALPLTVTWLEQRYYIPFTQDLHPPPHMVVRTCDISELKKSKRLPADEGADGGPAICGLCNDSMDVLDRIRCTHDDCYLVSHPLCLGRLLLLQETVRRHPTQSLPTWIQLNTEDSRHALTSSQRGSKNLSTGSQLKKSSQPTTSLDVSVVAPLIPVDGTCPRCKGYILWGELVRPLSVACASSRGGDRGKGVWVAHEEENEERESDLTDDDEDEDHWTNLLTQK